MSPNGRGSLPRKTAKAKTRGTLVSFERLCFCGVGIESLDGSRDKEDIGTNVISYQKMTAKSTSCTNHIFFQTMLVCFVGRVCYLLHRHFFGVGIVDDCRSWYVASDEHL